MKKIAKQGKYFYYVEVYKKGGYRERLINEVLDNACVVKPKYLNGSSTKLYYRRKIYSALFRKDPKTLIYRIKNLGDSNKYDYIIKKIDMKTFINIIPNKILTNDAFELSNFIENYDMKRKSKTYLKKLEQYYKENELDYMKHRIAEFWDKIIEHVKSLNCRISIQAYNNRDIISIFILDVVTNLYIAKVSIFYCDKHSNSITVNISYFQQTFVDHDNNIYYRYELMDNVQTIIERYKSDFDTCTIINKTTEFTHTYNLIDLASKWYSLPENKFILNSIDMEDAIFFKGNSRRGELNNICK